MQKKIFFITLFLSIRLLASDNSTFKFLTNDVGARSAALGGNTLILNDDPNVIFYNPASLTQLVSQQISIGYFKHLLDINTGHISYARFVEDFGYIGAGLIYTNYGELIKRNEFGDPMGNFSANELSVSIAYSHILYEKIFYGATAKFIYSSIDKYSSAAIAVDLGIMYKITPDKFHIAASITNLGTQLDPYIHTKESLPTNLGISSTIKPEHLPLVLQVGFSKLLKSRNDFLSHFKAFNLGGEFNLSDNLFLRFGYDNENRQDLKIGNSAGLAGFSIGFGVKLEQYKLDYAINSLGKAGAYHRITVGILF